MKHPEVILRLPGWIESLPLSAELIYSSTKDRMLLAINLARLNVEHQTGGPFGAAIFESKSGRLVSVGVNLVESSNCSIAHAEMVAIAIAQRALECYDLGADENKAYELVTSTEPCAMCLGAIPWSGVRSVVCGAADEDARRIGFDEGSKPEHWAESLESRGIRVLRNVLREEALAVLLDYHKQGGLIYNAHGRNERKEK